MTTQKHIDNFLKTCQLCPNPATANNAKYCYDCKSKLMDKRTAEANITYRKENKEKLQIYQREYVTKNREKINAKRRKRYAIAQ